MVEMKLTPEQVADAFWALGIDGQADFFAHLERIASWRL